MPVVQQRSKQVIALCVSDIHFSLKKPVFRSDEVDWLSIQSDYVRQLRELQEKYHCPILIAGDLFQRWDTSIYLANLVISWFKGMEIWAIAGNHDTPDHNPRQLQRSIYWNLVEAGVIRHITHPGPVGISSIEVWPFGHGYEVESCNGGGMLLKVALIHDFIWTEKTKCGLIENPDSNRYKAWLKKLKGYDVAIFGDNHKGFLIQGENGSPTVFNCGCFIRRHSDEVDCKPCVGMLHSDGSITRHYLDTSRDKFINLPEEIRRLESTLELDLSDFAEELSHLHHERLDYARTVLNWVKKENVPDRVREIILKALKGRK